MSHFIYVPGPVACRRPPSEPVVVVPGVRVFPRVPRLPVTSVDGRPPDRTGDVALADVARLVPGAVAGNLASLTGRGNPADSGIPSDAVRQAVAKAGTAYQKPEGGVPKTDLSEGVRASLDRADAAVQSGDILTGDGANKKIKSSLLPSYVDDVVEYASLSAFPRPGETGKIYVALDTNIQYRWSGTQYTEIAKIIVPSASAPLVDGAASAGSSEAYSRGDHRHPTDTSRMAANATGADIAVSGTDATKIDAALAGKASKSDVDPLLFSQYYPEGNVKSAAEFTPGIKYDDPDTTNRTITVKPFCNTGDSDNDNSGLVGRVVIPPFVDAQGNGYISDDGTRFRVVGVSEGSPDGGPSVGQIAIIAPSTVTTIGDSAFGSCTSLASVSLPAVPNIGGYAAFFNCTSLASVSLPAATTIGDSAFGSCASLTSVSLPAVTNIEGFAFYNCTSLTSVDFGATPRPFVPPLGANVFLTVPTTCKIVVPDAQYGAWTAASGWSDLVTAGYTFLRHSDWEYAHKYEVDKKADKPATFTTGNLAEFDSQGNPVDSGKKPSDFQSALSQTQLANIAAVSDALAFDATHSYGAGDPVVYNGTLYTFTTAHTGAWTGSDVSAVDIIARLAGKLDKSGGTVTDTLNIGDTPSATTITPTSGVTTPMINAGAANISLVQFDTIDAGGTLRLATPGATTNAVLIPLPQVVGSQPKTVAFTSDLPYSLGTPIVIDSESVQTDTTDPDNPITYAEVTLADRTANIVQIYVAIDELRVTLPAATDDKMRDFELEVGVGDGTAALAAPALSIYPAEDEDIALANPDGAIPELADGTATLDGSTVLYFTEFVPYAFLVKGEQLKWI